MTRSTLKTAEQPLRGLAFTLLITVAAACPAAGDDDFADGDSVADDDTTGDDDTAQDGGRYFPEGSPWYEVVSDAAVDPSSETLIGNLQTLGWGLGRFQMDFSLEVLDAPPGTERLPFTATEDFYSPDCDALPVPVPIDGNLEGEESYRCTTDGDCHLLVADRSTGELFEMWRADIDGATFRGGCLARWDMGRLYGPEGRGDQCSSADAGGYPIAPLLFTADEVASGVIDHALRFALPNDRIRDGEFFHPATHATNAQGGGPEALPYGARLRLRPDFDLSRIEDPDARVVAVALQTYGMFLADGGNVTLMGRSDRRTTAKWQDLFEEDFTWALVGIEPQDFEVLALQGPAIPLTFDCVRAD